MKILVIGDSCTDMFRYGFCERLSPEAPVPIFKPTKLETNGGMSLNVLENIRAFDDVECHVITNDFRPAKTRLVDENSNQIIVRIDENDDAIDVIENEVFTEIKFQEYDAVVISDYDKGFLSEKHIETISYRHPVTFLDTKKKLGDWAKNIEFIKINNNEFQDNYQWLTNKFKNQLIVTKGNEGAILNMKHRFGIENEHPVSDLSGAGDTFLAGLVVKFLEKNNINEAIRFANECASWAVTQKGVVAIDPTKI